MQNLYQLDVYPKLLFEAVAAWKAATKVLHFIPVRMLSDSINKRGLTPIINPFCFYFPTKMLTKIIPTASTSIVVDAPVQQMADVSGTAQLVALWLHDKSPKSQKSYERDIREFVAFLSHQPTAQARLNDVDLRIVTLNDVQQFKDYLEERSLKPRPGVKGIEPRSL